MLKSLIIILSLLRLDAVFASCPIEEDPANLARCIQVDITAVIYALRGKDDLTTFCQLADRYMECLKTYTRGCIGFHFAEGSLTELQGIALYCCKGIYTSPDCPLNLTGRKCFSDQSFVTLSNGSKKLLKDVAIGDVVKTLDTFGNLIDTPVIMFMDKDKDKSLFFNIQTHGNKSLVVSATHLIALPGGEYKFAKKLEKEDKIISYDFEKNTQVEDKIKSIIVEAVDGYSAPLTDAGTILVNDVLASCYAIIESHNIAHAAMAPVRWWRYMQPIDSSVATTEMSQNGVHWFPDMLFSLTNKFLKPFIKLY